MTKQEGTKFVEAMMNDEAFAERAAAVATPEELISLAAEADVDISSEDANTIMEQVTTARSGELSETDLENVSGGLGYLATCAVFGGVAGVVFGLIVVGAYYLYRKYGR